MGRLDADTEFDTDEDAEGDLELDKDQPAAVEGEAAPDCNNVEDAVALPLIDGVDDSDGCGVMLEAGVVDELAVG